MVIIGGRRAARCLILLWMARCAIAFTISIMLIVKIPTPTNPNLTLEEYRKEHGEPKLTQKKYDFRTNLQNQLRFAFIVISVYLLVTGSLRIIGTVKLCQSFNLCESNPEKALKCFNFWMYLEVGIGIPTLGLPFIFVFLLFPISLDFIFFWVGLGAVKFREGLLQEIRRRRLFMPMGGPGEGVNVYPGTSNSTSFPVPQVPVPFQPQTFGTNTYSQFP